MKRYFLAIAMAGFCLQAHAADLLTVYQQALQNDPVIQAAKATRDASMEGVPISEASLFPNIGATANTTSLHTSQSALGSTRAAESTNQHDYGLTLTQPLFNFGSWMQVRAAKDSSKQAEATYNAALQDLIIRVSTAYFNVLMAEDNLEFTQAQKTAIGSQLKQIREKYDVGVATMTDVYQAQADYDSLTAAEIAAQNTIANNMEALRQITGQTYNHLTPVMRRIPLISPIPMDPQKWVEAGEKNNWTLWAARYAELAAKENIRVNYAGHFPTVNAVGTYQNGNDINPAFPHRDQWQSTAGIQVSLPLFEGGQVVAQTHQAEDQYVAAGDQMESAYRQVVLQTEESFNNVMSGISQIEADKIAVRSAKSALGSTRAGYRAGTKTVLDVLTAEQNLYSARSALASDQYSYINNTLALKQASGSLNGTDVVAINSWLQDRKPRKKS